MTVADLIEELKKMPQHYPAMCEGSRVNESITHVKTSHTGDSIAGPRVIICREFDERNDLHCDGM